MIGPEKGGIAIFKDIHGKMDPFYKRKNVFDKIEIRDESIQHACPGKHSDFLYSYINIPITPTQLEDVNKLSGSVNYDMLKQELFARCAHTCANVITLYLATEIIVNDIMKNDNYKNIEQIHNKGLYGEMIQQTGELEFVQDIYDKLAKNIDIIKSSQELPDDYWPGAFSENCGKPKN